MPYLPTFLQRGYRHKDSVPKIFGSAFETLMLSFDLTGLEISLSRSGWSQGRLGLAHPHVFAQEPQQGGGWRRGFRIKAGDGYDGSRLSQNGHAPDAGR
jgi:hypothetical protein